VTARLRRLAQLALAALVASGAGGLILAILLLFAALAAAAAGQAGAGGTGPAPADATALLGVAIFGSGLAMAASVGTGWLPAFVIGSALWAAGRSCGWARRPFAWALAGAAVALICYVQAFPPGARDPSAGRFPVPRPAVAALFMLAGAAAGQVYCSAMRAAAPFFGFDEQDETG
jgi:membrane protease YdiL (CAAX protease family)